jgi:hypothetical protein
MPSNYGQSPLISSPVCALSSLVPMTKIPKPSARHLLWKLCSQDARSLTILKPKNTRSRLAKEHAKEIHRFLPRDSLIPVASRYAYARSPCAYPSRMQLATAKEISEQQPLCTYPCLIPVPACTIPVTKSQISMPPIHRPYQYPMPNAIYPNQRNPK